MKKSDCIIETPLTNYLKTEVYDLQLLTVKFKNSSEPVKQLLISKIEMIQAVIQLTKQTDESLIRFSNLKSLDEVRYFKS